jgi:hypothetical protein
VTVLALPFPSRDPPFDVPKELIRPAEDVVAGVGPYDVDLEKVVKRFEANEKKLTTERARTKDPRPDEIERLEGLEANWLKLLNERLIQGTMFNRFDAEIKNWTEHYNTKFGFTGKKAADPDMVKAMIFEESQMGTAGPHLDDPPTHPVRTRFNIGQMIDTSSLVLLELIREDEPTLVDTYHLKDIETDLVAAQNELERLKKLAHPNAVQRARIDELTRLSGRYWEVFMWGYKAPGQTAGFFAAVNDYFGDRGGKHRNLSYDFWIRASIRELFDKRKLVSSVGGGRARVQRSWTGRRPLEGQGHGEDGPRQGRAEGQEAVCGRQHLSAAAFAARSRAPVADRDRWEHSRVSSVRASWGGDPSGG